MDITPPARIWIISLDHWPRAYLRAELIERGYDAVGFITLPDATTRLNGDGAEKPDAIILDLHQLTSDDDALIAEVFRQDIPMLAIASAVDPASELFRHLPWAAFLRRPVRIGAVADALGELSAAAAP